MMPNANKSFEMRVVTPCHYANAGPFIFTAPVFAAIFGSKLHRNINEVFCQLELLLMPDTWWDTISVNFIVGVLESDRYNVIMVVVDSLCKVGPQH